MTQQSQQTMKIAHILTCTLPLLILGCHKESNHKQATLLSLPPDSHVAVSEWDKVKISSSGEIFVNKKQVSLTEFATECQRLKQASGGAMVYTGDGDHVFSPAQTKAVSKLIDAGVPMKAVQKESELD
jgi:biopolymer transport protein ExbD